MTRHLKRTVAILIAVFGSVGVSIAEAEPQLGMSWDQMERVYNGCIASRWKRDQMILKVHFFGYSARVIASFDSNEKVDSLNIRFAIQDADSDPNARLRIFEEVRRRLQKLGGEVQTDVRVNGVDLLGARGRVGLDDVPENLVSFVVLKDGIAYGLKIQAPKLAELGRTGEIELEIQRELPSLNRTSRQPGHVIVDS